MRKNPLEYYRALGLNPGATADEIKQAYRRLLQTWHPDHFKTGSLMQTTAEDVTKEINEAYEQLLKKQLYKNSSLRPPRLPSRHVPPAPRPRTNRLDLPPPRINLAPRRPVPLSVADRRLPPRRDHHDGPKPHLLPPHRSRLHLPRVPPIAGPRQGAGRSSVAWFCCWCCSRLSSVKTRPAKNRFLLPSQRQLAGPRTQRNAAGFFPRRLIPTVARISSRPHAHPPPAGRRRSRLRLVGRPRKILFPP